MAGKTKQSEPKMRLDLRAKMYIVLVICSLMLLASVGVAFFLVGGFGSSEDAASDSAVEPESIITESGYNKEENTIDTTAYSATILPESSDAGQTYVDETLFLGDSNTARMYRMFDFCTYDNAIGSVGMSAKSLATYACVELNNSGSYVTMAKAVAGMQPKRVIITFGTNDLSPSYKAADFVKNYQTGIESIVEAYPSADIIINAIPPLGQQHSNQSLTQTQVDEYNKALVEMCKEKGWKFLNSAEVLKDSATGYAKSGYVESSDGIHLTRAAMEALFDYIRTHSCITEDDLTKVSRQLTVSMGSMFYILNVFAAIMFLLLMYLLTKLIIEKNKTSISMTKILGYQDKEIASLYLTATTWVVVVSMLISEALATLSMSGLYRELLKDYSGWMELYINPVTYVEMFFIGLLSYAAVAATQMRRIRRVPLDEALKNQE